MEKSGLRVLSKTVEIIVKGNWEEICRLIRHIGLTIGLLGRNCLESEQNSLTSGALPSK